MKTITIGIITTSVVIAIITGTFVYQQYYNQRCIEGDGEITGFLHCTRIFEDKIPNKDVFYGIHDAVVQVDLLAYSFEDEQTYMMVKVVEFLKNPTNATHLTIWGNFNEFKEYCKNNDCDQAIAYLYQDKNGIYHKGDYWEWIDSEETTRVEKSIQCYEMFHCDLSDAESFSSCKEGKINGQSIREICANPDITIDGGCVKLNYQNISTIKCE